MSQPQRLPCPACHQPIVLQARKCRYCLEYLPDGWSERDGSDALVSESDSVEATPQAAEPPPLSNLLSMICGSTADHPSGLVEGAEGLEDGELPAWAIEVEEGAASGSTDDLPSHFFEARPSILPALLFTFVFFPIMGLLTLLGGAGFSSLHLRAAWCSSREQV